MAAKGTTEANTSGEPRFEDALGELEGVVRRLEQGELPLEDSLAAFERGMALVKQLSKRLEDIERRVEVLLKQDDGSIALRSLDDDET
jgi:exodeoxyribonuclease VII small subunit